MRSIFSKSEVDELDFSLVLIDHDIFRLQIPEHYLMLVEVVEQDQSLGCEVLDLIELDADLVFLELK